MAKAIVFDCIQCGNAVRRAKYNKYCSRACHRANRKASNSRNCDECGIWYSPIRLLTNRSGATRAAPSLTATCSKECCRKLSSKKISMLVGSRKGNWKGGVSADHNHGFRGTNWPAVAESIRVRDGLMCRHCGLCNSDHKAKYGKSLDVHHVIPFHNFTDARKANRPANLVTLCIPCHRTADSEVEAVQMSLPLSIYPRGNRSGLARGESHGQARLNDEAVMLMRAMKAKGISVYRIAIDAGVAYMTAKYAINGKTWRHLPTIHR